MSVTHIYLFDYDVPIDGSRECSDYLAFHAMKATLVPSAMRKQPVLELQFENRRLIAATSHYDGTLEPIELDASAKRIHLDNVPQWPLFKIEQSTTATGSRLGGTLPAGFELPISLEPAPFQYLGTLTSRLTGLEWLPADLHLTAPTINCFSRLFVDYSDPLCPKLLNSDDQGLEGIDLSQGGFDEKDLESQRLTVRERHLVSAETTTWIVENDTAGLIGIPDWASCIDVPHCPVTGGPMRFVCDLNPSFLVDFVDGSPLEPDEIMTMAADQMAGFVDGRFYVFMHPESLVVCYVIQCT